MFLSGADAACAPRGAYRSRPSNLIFGGIGVLIQTSDRLHKALVLFVALSRFSLRDAFVSPVPGAGRGANTARRLFAAEPLMLHATGPFQELSDRSAEDNRWYKRAPIRQNLALTVGLKPPQGHFCH